MYRDKGRLLVLNNGRTVAVGAFGVLMARRVENYRSFFGVYVHLNDMQFNWILFYSR